MASENKTQVTDISVDGFLTSLESEQVRNDCIKLVAIMSKISQQEAKMWGTSIIGFDKYHYKYASGREGDAPVLGFSPRKGKLTVYVEESLMSSDLFSNLGKHSTSKVCIYFKKLSDIDASVLEKILKKSFQLTKSLKFTEHGC